VGNESRDAPNEDSPGNGIRKKRLGGRWRKVGENCSLGFKNRNMHLGDGKLHETALRAPNEVNIERERENGILSNRPAGQALGEGRSKTAFIVESTAKGSFSKVLESIEGKIRGE